MKTRHNKKSHHSRLRRPHRAALTLVEPEAGSVQFERILIPTDFSPMSLKAVRYGLRFAEQYGATIRLLYVIEPPGISLDAEAFSSITPLEAHREHCKRQLLSLADEQLEELPPVQAEVRVGHPAAQICDAARELEADLIIISTHGRTGLNWMLVGGTVEKVVRHALCPVFVLREAEELICP